MKDELKQEIIDLIEAETNYLRCRTESLHEDTGNPLCFCEKVVPNNKELNERLSKVETIVRANDYEFKTETKLIEKKKESESD